MCGSCSSGKGVPYSGTSPRAEAYAHMMGQQEKLEKWKEEYLDAKTASYPQSFRNASEVMPYQTIGTQDLDLKNPVSYSPNYLSTNPLLLAFHQNPYGYSTKKENHSQHKKYN